MTVVSVERDKLICAYKPSLITSRRKVNDPNGGIAVAAGNGGAQNGGAQSPTQTLSPNPSPISSSSDDSCQGSKRDLCLGLGLGLGLGLPAVLALAAGAYYAANQPKETAFSPPQPEPAFVYLEPSPPPVFIGQA